MIKILYSTDYIDIDRPRWNHTRPHTNEQVYAPSAYRNNNKYMRYLQFFPQQQNAMGSLHNIDFGVFWASWGGSGKKPGSGNRFRELVPGTSSGNRIRVSMGSDRFCGSKVPVQKVAWKRFRRFRCLTGSEKLGSVPEVLTEPFLGTGCQEPEVLRRFGAKVSDNYSVLRKYTLVHWKCTFVLWKYAFAHWKYTSCALQVYFSMLKVCFCSLKVSFCT